MKKLFFILIIFSGCKKSETTVTIQVKEAVTGSPVAGVSVSLRRCANAGCSLGIVTEYSGTTDGNGILRVPQDKWDNLPAWNDAIFVSKPGYWTEIFSKTNSVSIIPTGWIRVRIIRGSSYPQGSSLDIHVWPQVNPAGTALGNTSSYLFNTAADSSVLITAFGNQLNKIDWRVVSNSVVLSNGTLNQQVPMQDTVSAVLNY
jgi:hypothetical protein